ncbi:hypothetical protein [Labrenzia sp. DG1229]|uniref:hypothetical protein n=1 Tax=Labrenzia sp. DG1229 TaxID=681847 RepID=UPI00048D4C15|nr:hypothetical protein [Labrenzia sp. DG1229]
MHGAPSRMSFNITRPVVANPVFDVHCLDPGASNRFPDAELYSPCGPSSIGRPQIGAIHEDRVSEGGENKKIRVESAACSGDLEWCVTSISEEGSENDVSLNVLDQQADGDWMSTRDSLNKTP